MPRRTGIFVLSPCSKDKTCSVCLDGGGVMMFHIPDIGSPGRHAVHLDCLEQWCLFNIEQKRGITCPACSLPCFTDLFLSTNVGWDVDPVALLNKTTEENTIEALSSLRDHVSPHVKRRARHQQILKRMELAKTIANGMYALFILFHIGRFLLHFQFKK